jgi:hypothetical protein
MGVEKLIFAYFSNRRMERTTKFARKQDKYRISYLQKITILSV